MSALFDSVNAVIGTINGYLWHNATVFVILATGVLFLFWTKLGPLVALKYGSRIVRGKYNFGDAGPGAITHFQALTAALSATVGLGNIGGVAVAIALGGPGAVFWMWVVGFIGMALKMVEVTLSMLYRDVSDPDNPHGGPMHVIEKGLKEMNPALAGLGKALGGLFCITLLISAITGGNMFQAWNVSILNKHYLNVPPIYSGIALAIITGLVIIGGIKRIGHVAEKLVPLMCGLYLIGALYVLAVNIQAIPSMFALIIKSAFSPTEAQGAFVGGTAGFAFLWGMKRALFSNEAGQGSAPIAHSAVKTSEPASEGIVAGLEPFIDTLVVCTLTALVVLVSGAWNRGPEAQLESLGEFSQTSAEVYQLEATQLPNTRKQVDIETEWQQGQRVFTLVEAENLSETHQNIHRLYGTVSKSEDGIFVQWDAFSSHVQPQLKEPSIFGDYAGAALTSHAFDRVHNGLGRYLVTIVAFLFAISTMISWNYYGEQGMVYLFGPKSVLPYKIIYCLSAVVACTDLIKSDAEIDNISGLGMGVMLVVNIPICIIFGKKAIVAYNHFFRRLKAGEFSK